MENLEKFARLLHKVEGVQRISRRPDEKEMTNTAEHTFELVMLCWYIVHTHKLDLSIEKILKYALAHDVVEAYAGDTFAYDEEARKTKHEREAAALRRLESEFPEFDDLTKAISDYENKADEEARFVLAVDKLIDPLSSSMETTQSIWKEYNISLDTVTQHKSDNIGFRHPLCRIGIFC